MSARFFKRWTCPGLVALLLLLTLVSLPACASAKPTATGDEEEGIASYYAPRFHGQRTASGERYDQEALTAAHRTLPFGTIVRVTNLENDRSIEVRINDRGPFVRGRIIDLSKAAARALRMVDDGIVEAHIEVVEDAG